jgi:sigma-B regulation protein RsbU (phosphoserine phosphatase)
MTLFYLTVDPANQNLQWVRAGHDPGIFYDPFTDTFEDLKGKGIALGVDEDWQYEMNERIGIVKGQIIVLSTDGVWEAHNRTGEIFGKARLYEIIRQNSVKKAKEIIEAVIAALGRFQKDLAIEDDITLVVVKIEEDLGNSDDKK